MTEPIAIRSLGGLTLTKSAVGVSLKTDYFAEIVAEPPAVDFFEFHAENAMVNGGAVHHWLSQIQKERPLSIHGVGLSLGSAEGPDPDHLRRLRDVVCRYQPILLSEHVSFSVVQGRYLNQLAPLPYTKSTLALLCEHIDCAQTVLQRPLLMENPSRYFAWQQSDLEEPEFLAEMARRTGCGLLLDVNNVFVSAENLSFDPYVWLRSLASHGVEIGEIHLAGHTVKQTASGHLRIDDHGSPVCDAVWQLYHYALGLFGPCPTLIEWDSDLPPFSVLLGEAQIAREMMAATIRDANEACHA